MAAFYKSYKPRTFDPQSPEPFRVSRSKIDFFMDCPRCYYMEARFGCKRPSMASFTLNIAVDVLLKKEFDAHRAVGTKHPLQEQYGIDAVPFRHEQLDQWRENFVGVQTLHAPTNLLVFGAVDDVWVTPTGELLVVDYKATSKDAPVVQLEDTKWHDQYRRQMEIYQWLLRQNGFSVSNTGYFVYVNAKKDLPAFHARLEFDVALIAYTGSSDWVDGQLERMKACLLGELPALSPDCEYCNYRVGTQVVEVKQVTPPAASVPVLEVPVKKVKKAKTGAGEQGQTLF